MYNRNSVLFYYGKTVLILYYTIISDLVGKHFRLAEVLYYKVLESVIKQEKKRLEEADLSVRIVQ